MTPFRIVFITVPNKEEAKRLAHGLVTEHLAACVNIVPNIESVYRWQGEIHEDEECLLICKTDAARWAEFHVWVKSHHSYEVPEILQIPVMEGSPPYLQWLEDCLQK
jgi:periplasmic divalent cation tolerance protein